MALFFNIENLEKVCGGNYVKLVQVLESFYKGTIPKNAYSKLPKYDRKDLFGESFLLNPADLFNSNAEIAYKAQYIRLAARRSYFMYKTHKFTGLDLRLYPDVDLGLIKPNPLILLTDNSTIKFKFEDK